MDGLLCEEKKLHADAMHEAEEKLPDENALRELSGFFRVFGDMTRVSILYALSAAELCVCDIAEMLNASQSAVSHQLGLLRSSRLVKYRRDGKTVYYSLDDEHISAILSIGMEHIKE